MTSDIMLRTMSDRRLLADGLRILRPADDGGRGEMLTGALGTLILRCGAAVFAFLATLILARNLGASGYGTYAWAFAWSSVLQIITTFGFDVLAIREFAAHKATSAWSAMHGLLRTGPAIVFIGSSAVALIAVVAGAVFLGPAERSTFIIAVAFVPLLAVTATRQGAIQGLGSVAAARLPNDFVGPMIFIGFLLLAWRVLGLRQSPPIAMALQGAAISIAFLFGWIVLRRILPSQVRPAPVQARTREWLRLAIPLGLLNSIAIVLTQVDIILLGLLRNSTQVGIYSTSTRVASLVGIAEFAVNAAYLPVVARLFAADRIERLRSGAPKVTLAAVSLSFAFAAPLIVFAPQILGLFGSSFESGAFILRVLCVTFLISAAAGQNGTLLTMTRHVRPVMIGSTLALVSNVALNLILIPLDGARGAAIAWLLSVIVWNGFLSWQVRRIYGFTATPLALVPLLRQRINDARRPGNDV
jgi:O-antigen/teichoic acid export membrane protein